MNNDYLMGGRMSGYAPSYLASQNNATNVIWTMGLESAKAYPMMPGRTLLLMDSESPRFFIKTVDMNGYATIKAYSFKEENAAEEPMPAANWVTKEQLDAAIAAILTEVRQKAPEPVANKNLL